MHKTFLVFTCLLISGAAFAQIPRDIPHQSEPVDFSNPTNILLYIGIPLVMIVLYVFIRRRRRRDREGDSH